MLALAYDNDSGEGDVVYGDGCLVDDGFDLETAMLLSLLLDAPAQDGDDVAVDSSRRGWWADVFDEDGAQTGSRLWLLEDAVATDANCRIAEQYALEALKWLTDGGYVRAIECTAEVGRYENGDDGIWLATTATTKDGRKVALGPFGVT